MMGNSARGSRWTAEKEQLLRDMWADGADCNNIASALGEGFTKNSVIGRAHRIKLPTHAYAQTRGSRMHLNQVEVRRRGAKVLPSVSKPSKPRKPARVATVHPFRPEFIKPTGAAWAAIAGTAPVSLADLASGQCKWPVGDDGARLFCGQHADHGVYCEHHHLWSVGRGTTAEQRALKTAITAVKYERREAQVAA